MIGNNPLGASAYIDAKPAIVSKKEVTNEWHEARLKYDMESMDKDSLDFETHLAEWKDSGLWRKKYASWNEACDKGVGFTARWTNKLISRVSRHNETANVTDPQSESCKNTRQKANESQETPGTPVPVCKASNSKQEPCQPSDSESSTPPEALSKEPPKDASGCVIPQKLLATRNRRQEITDLEHKASVLHALFIRLQTNHDTLFNHLLATGQVQTFAAGAGSMRYALAECQPDIVCPQCIGVAAKCHVCHGTGWISQVRWNRDWVKSHDTTKAAVVRQRTSQ